MAPWELLHAAEALNSKALSPAAQAAQERCRQLSMQLGSAQQRAPAAWPSTELSGVRIYGSQRQQWGRPSSAGCCPEAGALPARLLQSHLCDHPLTNETTPAAAHPLILLWDKAFCQLSPVLCPCRAAGCCHCHVACQQPLTSQKQISKVSQGCLVRRSFLQAYRKAI